MGSLKNCKDLSIVIIAVGLSKTMCCHLIDDVSIKRLSLSMLPLLPILAFHRPYSTIKALAIRGVLIKKKYLFIYSSTEDGLGERELLRVEID